MVNLIDVFAHDGFRYGSLIIGFDHKVHVGRQILDIPVGVYDDQIFDGIEDSAAFLQRHVKIIVFIRIPFFIHSAPHVVCILYKIIGFCIKKRWETLAIFFLVERF